MDESNNVWNTIRELGNNALSQYSKIVGIQANEAQTIAQINANAYTAINGRAAAAPSGYVGGYVVNPPPGTFGNFPQAQGKPTPGESDFMSPITGGNDSSALVIGAIVAVIVAMIFLRAKR